MDNACLAPMHANSVYWSPDGCTVKESGLTEGSDHIACSTRGHSRKYIYVIIIIIYATSQPRSNEPVVRLPGHTYMDGSIGRTNTIQIQYIHTYIHQAKHYQAAYAYPSHAWGSYSYVTIQ